MSSSTFAWDLRQSRRSGFALASHSSHGAALKRSAIASVNHQHLWLLATAHEAFERYIVRLYASLGYLDRDVWRAAHFGDVSLRDIRTRQLSWFMERARAVARRNTEEIRSVLYQRLPRLKSIEERNPVADLTFWVPAIATFRHIIVHGQGRVSEAELLGGISRATGRSLDGPATARWRNAILRYARARGHGVRDIWLVDERDPSNRGVFVQPFSDLLGLVSSAGALLHAEAMAHFGHEVIW